MNNKIFNYDVIFTLSTMDLKLKYQNSKIGFLWSFLKPLLQFIAYYTVFQVILKVSDSPDYPLRLFLGILIWTLFTDSTSNGMMSYVGKKTIVTKINIQKSILPVSAFLTAVFNFLLNLIIFLVLYHIISPNFLKIYHFSNLLLFLVSLALFSGALVSINIILATLNALFRDIQSIWEIFLMYGVFLSPIMYTLPIPNQFLGLYYFVNPIAFPLENIRSIFFESSGLWNNINYTICYLAGTIFYIMLAYVVNKKLHSKVADFL